MTARIERSLLADARDNKIFRQVSVHDDLPINGHSNQVALPGSSDEKTRGFDYLFDNKDIFYLFCKTLARTITMTRISN